MFQPFLWTRNGWRFVYQEVVFTMCHFTSHICMYSSIEWTIFFHYLLRAVHECLVEFFKENYESENPKEHLHVSEKDRNIWTIGIFGQTSSKRPHKKKIKEKILPGSSKPFEGPLYPLNLLSLRPAFSAKEQPDSLKFCTFLMTYII